MKRVLSGALVLVLLFAVGSVFAGGKQEAPPLGSEKNPIVWSFVPSGEMERVAGGARDVADLLFKETGLYIKTNVATEYSGVIEALSSNPPSAQMSSLATFAYILAAERKVSQVALVSSRGGSLTYNGQILVRKGSGISTIADLKGKTFARPDGLSTSGWIAPSIALKGAKLDPAVDFARIVDAGSHDAVVAAVYNGDVDAGSTYVDARTRVEKQFPDVMDKLVVIAISEAIPNDGVQFHPSVPKETRDKIVEGLLAILKTEEGKKAIGTAYQWTALEKRDDRFYDPFRQYLQAAGVRAEDLLKK